MAKLSREAPAYGLTPERQQQIRQILTILLTSKSEADMHERVGKVVGNPLSDAAKNWFLSAQKAVKEIVNNPAHSSPAEQALILGKTSIKEQTGMSNYLITLAFNLRVAKEEKSPLKYLFLIRNPNQITETSLTELWRLKDN